MSGSLAKTAGRESPDEELHLGTCKSGVCQPGTNGRGSLPPHSGNPESRLNRMQKQGNSQDHLQSPRPTRSPKEAEPQPSPAHSGSVQVRHRTPR